MSNFAFGTYKLNDINIQHIEALKEAINGGINLVVTSSNYTTSEQAIGSIFSQMDDSLLEDVEIVSKYKLSQNLDEQLLKSLDNLGVSSIDCYLVEGVEEILANSIKEGVSRDDMLDEVYAKLFDAFLELEVAVKEGKINSYGVSSESFSQPSNSKLFLPYEDLLTLAQDASSEVRNEKHSFSTIELPVNILETDGIKCSKWAKENSLRVLSTRALSAYRDGKMYRLAEYDESREYYHYLNELLEICDNDLLEPLYNLIEQLDDKKHLYSWIGEYEDFLIAEIIPHIKKSLEVLDDGEGLDTILRYIDIFLTEYRKMVSYECGRKTKLELQDEFEALKTTTLQKYALNFLLDIDTVDFIVVGMPKVSYIDEVLELV